MGNPTVAGREWNFIWRQSMFDNEIDMAARFLGDIEGSFIHPDQQDKRI